ncbi:MAG: hypothetical protein NWQ29_00075 [Alphaproteobacteria bacterium]|nr:hypothetical protein [Alphaproteobacteria bacterium]MDP5012095.1 hypothetical protein [Alphaproteobacteria bacterium]
MTQILQIFTVILALTSAICVASETDQLEQRPSNSGAEIFDENSFPNPNGSASSPETIRAFKWNSPKQPVDLESFLSRSSHVYLSSINLSHALSEKPKSKKITTGVKAFVELHFSKKPAAQGTSVQSHKSMEHTASTKTAKGKKRSSNQPSIASFFKKPRTEGSNNHLEALTDRESIAESDSLASSSSALSTSSSINSYGDDSHSDSSF